MVYKRMIHPTIWTNRKVRQLTPLERLTFIGLICLADDEGRFDADGAIVKGALFPSDKKIGAKRVAAMVRRCADEGLIKVYYAKDGTYVGCHPNWKKYQKLTKQPQTFFPPPEDGLSKPPTNLGREDEDRYGRAKGREGKEAKGRKERNGSSSLSDSNSNGNLKPGRRYDTDVGGWVDEPGEEAA